MTIFGYKPVILMTDALLYLLVVITVLAIFYIRSKEHLIAPWRQVARSRLGMASAVLLSFYVVVGLVDSIHFREPIDNAVADNGEQHYSVEALSLLDVVLAPLRERVEVTYSAPFATHSYSKESVELEDGTKSRDYVRLQYGGAHLEDPADRTADIVKYAVMAFILAVIIGLIVTFLLTQVYARKRQYRLSQAWREIWRGESELPWNVMLITFWLMTLFVVFACLTATKYHVLGTDKVGQDVLYQALKSIRTGLVIGTLSTLVMLPFAVLLGILAGYFRGWVDDLIQYIYTTLNSIPSILLIAAAVLIVQAYIQSSPDMFETQTERADVKLLFLCMILGIMSWTGLCRLLRGEAMKLREVDYIQAADAFGVPKTKVITRHILPNVMHIVLIAVVLDFSGLVLAEAFLSYVGVGVDPTTHSWGNMINSARLEMAREPMVWWSLLAAFWFMFLLVLAANLFADAVRDAFDPRLRQQ